MQPSGSMPPPALTGQYPGGPGMPFAPPKKKGHGCLIASIITLVLILGGGAAAYFAVRYYATKAMDTLTSALGDGGLNVLFTGDGGLGGLRSPDAGAPAPAAGAEPTVRPPDPKPDPKPDARRPAEPKAAAPEPKAGAAKPPKPKGGKPSDDIDSTTVLDPFK
jgi:hypothetical protein